MENKTQEKKESWQVYIIGKLEGWLLSFADWEEDEEAYNIIEALIKRFKENKCNKEDYENILFHLWQISEGEENE